MLNPGPLSRIPMIPVLAMSMVMLGSAFAPVAAQEPDITAGVSKLELIQAQNGSPDAQYYLGTRYEAGIGVEKDMKQALVWYQQAANGGHPLAQFKLGELYEDGHGVERNSTQAYAWYSLAASNGNRDAKRKLQEAEQRQKNAAAAQQNAAAEAQRQAQEAAALAEAERQAEQRRQAAAREKARVEAAAKAAAAKKAAKPPASKPVQVAVATERKAAPQPQFPDIREVVLKSEWEGDTGPTPFLPSELNSCLSATEQETVCFSQELNGVLKGQEITYTVKATLTAFQDNGRFKVAYLYNVLDLDRAKDQTERGVLPGLRAEEGWIDPVITLACQARSRTHLNCVYGGGELNFTAR